MRTLTVMLLVTWILAAGAAGRNVIYVDAENPNCPGSGTQNDPFCKIQDAINAAVDGDAILVLPGTYYELIDFGIMSLTVRSDRDGDPGTYDPDPAVTIIDGQRGGSVVTFVDNGDVNNRSVLEGFTIQNGLSGSEYGGGILCENSTPVVRNCRVVDNQAGSGGGVAVRASHGLFERLLICGNRAVHSGGGVFTAGIGYPFYDYDESVFCNSLIVGNVCDADDYAHYGGGAVGSNQGMAVFDLVTMCYNVAGSGVRRGAVAADNQPSGGQDKEITIKDCVLWANGQDPVYLVVPDTTQFTYSDLEFGTGQPWFGTGCIEDDPLFGDPTGDCDGDYHLLVGSPCINTGNPNWSSPCGEGCCDLDIDGEPRPDDRSGIVDMGCDEFWQLPPPFDCPHGSGITGMVAKWHFDEGSGTVFYDSKDAHDGDMRNGDFWTQAGFCGPAVELDGTVRAQRHLVVRDHPELGEEGLGRSLAVYLFFKLNSLPDNHYFLYEKDLNYYAEVTSSGTVRAGIWVPGPPPQRVWVESAHSIVPGEWYHCLFTFESDIDRARLWLNGSLEAENLVFTDEMAASDAALIIGEGAGHPDYAPIDGVIDEMTIGTFAPWILLDGDFRPGGWVQVRYGLRPFKDAIYAVWGLPSIDCPGDAWCSSPFDGVLCVSMPSTLFIMPGWVLPEFVLQGNIPNDSTYSGLEIALQALIGDFSVSPRDAAWTNCSVLHIR